MSASKVNDQESKRAEARRLQERMDKSDLDTKSQQARANKFSSLVKSQEKKEAVKNQQQAGMEKHQREELQNQSKHGQKATDARQARMARGGMVQHSRIMEQAKSFQQSLSTVRQDSKADQDTKTNDRSEGMASIREAVQERVEDIDERQELQKEVNAEEEKVESQRQDALESGVQSSTEKPDRDRQQNQDQDQHEGGQPSVESAAPVEQAQQLGYTSATKQIPDAILEKLASNVWMGINEKGLNTFRIELKEGVLQGASVQVSAEGSKISLRIDGLDSNAQNLIEASKGSLMRKLASKGLELEELSVGPKPGD